MTTEDPIILNVPVNDQTFDPETEEVVQYRGEPFPRIRRKALDRCQHIQCKASSLRQDLQCQRPAHGPETRHLHTVALGWCNPRFADLASAEGRTGGHAVPVR